MKKVLAIRQTVVDIQGMEIHNDNPTVFLNTPLVKTHHTIVVVGLLRPNGGDIFPS